jgi:hypothetical protein
VQTTVPFKPTQGRPVLCRQCFQAKARAAAAKPAEVAAQATIAPGADTVAALQDASANSHGATLSPDAAVVAAATMAAASPNSSVASAADLASITSAGATPAEPAEPVDAPIPAELVAAAANGDSISHAQELRACAAEAPEA